MKIHEITYKDLHKYFDDLNQSKSLCDIVLDLQIKVLCLEVDLSSLRLKQSIQEELEMDKQINKVKKDLDKGEKDTKKLLKMDKKFDKKLEKCDKMMKGKKK